MKQRMPIDSSIIEFFILIFLAMASLLYSSGCAAVYIPTLEHGYQEMREIEEDMLNQLEPGTTTRDDMKLRLGNPNGHVVRSEGNGIP